MATPSDSTPMQKYKLVFLGEQSEDRTVRLQLWDTAGQERFRSLIPSYIRDSSVAVIIYDITDRTSFTNTTKWIEDARQERGNDVIIVLVGNKTDISDKRAVSTEEGEKKAREVGATFMETSAKAGYNIKELFKKIARQLPYQNSPNPDAVKASMIDVTLNPSGSNLGSSDCSC
ncbi:GTP-binding protein ryh1 [Smittium mucronatum]|uniref:GTP-binding protein ryh1 n=1 Tax=Smittium mucronatum TaxID=133383 RepID=A0A1R0GT39_9FUNG|nr:GTP-binding protein ryh1 [Smittium mucronatum]